MKKSPVDINSPEVLLNSWIDMNVRIWFDRGFKNKAKIGKILLAHIFSFGDEHGKLAEVFEWLKSDHARHVLTKDGDDQGGVWVLDAIESLPFGKTVTSAEILKEKIDAYIYKHYEVTKYDLKLGDPVYVRS
jgi:hypothetical protein